MTRAAFEDVLRSAAEGWANGDAAAVADCFAADVEYLDPYLYRFTRRDDLLPFFEPPPGGHRVVWHTILWDEDARTGVVEYTYEGHHRYHGAAVARLGPDGRIALWREWQHLDDAATWDQRLGGPRATDDTDLSAVDHVQLGMPAGGEDAARAFYTDVLDLREVAKPPQLAGRDGVWFAARGVAIHLGVEHDFRRAERSHPAFVVDDIVGLRARLSGLGIDIEDDDSGLPVARCYVRDPFGNRIELVDAADAGFSVRPTPA